jgi:ESS family glutamate:Na+ symporter
MIVSQRWCAWACSSAGTAPEASLVVPVVGAFLIDFANSLIITAMANLIG